MKSIDRLIRRVRSYRLRLSVQELSALLLALAVALLASCHRSSHPTLPRDPGYLVRMGRVYLETPEWTVEKGALDLALRNACARLGADVDQVLQEAAGYQPATAAPRPPIGRSAR